MKFLLSSLALVWSATSFAGQFEIDALGSIPYARQQVAAHQLKSPQLFNIATFKTQGADATCADLGQTYTFMNKVENNEQSQSGEVKLWLTPQRRRCVWQSSTKVINATAVEGVTLDTLLGQNKILQSSLIVYKIRAVLAPKTFAVDSVALNSQANAEKNPTYTVVGHVADVSSTYTYDAVTGMPIVAAAE